MESPLCSLGQLSFKEMAIQLHCLQTFSGSMLPGENGQHPDPSASKPDLRLQWYLGLHLSRGSMWQVLCDIHLYVAGALWYSPLCGRCFLILPLCGRHCDSYLYVADTVILISMWQVLWYPPLYGKCSVIVTFMWQALGYSSLCAGTVIFASMWQALGYSPLCGRHCNIHFYVAGAVIFTSIWQALWYSPLCGRRSVIFTSM